VAIAVHADQHGAAAALGSTLRAGEPLFEGGRAHAAQSTQRRFVHDRPPADARRQLRPQRPLRVHPAERGAHQRAPAVVAEAALVLIGRHPVRAQVRVGQLAERPAAQQAHDGVFRDRAPRVRQEDAELHLVEIERLRPDHGRPLRSSART